MMHTKIFGRGRSSNQGRRTSLVIGGECRLQHPATTARMTMARGVDLNGCPYASM
ncbi:hypothetical protein PVAP13_7NG109312 [Panicum virgatum]|uniref:Uncharacterized protein n=1 Tax=Panicum virgatum TaxID=38727 RepID=A0A8T0Q1A2_PANVG|nr:hypothetical protein PVAP13_7NG109312 [Panicum virgatum]